MTELKKNRMLSTIEASKILGITPAYMRRLMTRGEIQGEKLGNNYWMITRKSLTCFKRQRFKKSDKESVDGSNKRRVKVSSSSA